MPTLGANSLGFMLELDTTKFKSAFKEVRDSYKSLTSELNKSNKNLNTAGQNFINNVGVVLKASVKSYKDQIAKVQAYASANPIIQPVHFVVSSQSQAALAAAAQKAATVSVSGAGAGGIGGGGVPSVRGLRGSRGMRDLGVIARARGLSLSAQGTASSLSRAMADLRLAEAGMIPGRDAIAGNARGLLNTLQGSLSAAELKALGPALLQTSRELLRVETNITRQKNSQARLAAQQANQSAKAAAAAQRALQAQQRAAQQAGILQSNTWRGALTRIVQNPLNILGGTYALTNLAHLVGMSANTMGAISGAPGISGSREFQSEFSRLTGQSRQTALDRQSGIISGTPGASSSEIRRIALESAGIPLINRNRADAAMVNAERLNISAGASGAFLRNALRDAGVGENFALDTMSRFALNARARGQETQVQSSEMMQIISSALARDTALLTSRGPQYAESYIRDLTALAPAMTQAARGDTGGFQALTEMLGTADITNPNSKFGAAFGIQKGMTPMQVFRQLQSRRSQMQQVMSTNARAFESEGITAQMLTKLYKSTGPDVDVALQGSTAGSSLDQLSTAAGDTRDALDSLMSSLSQFGMFIDRITGGTAGQAVSFLGGAASVASGVANSYLMIQAMRGKLGGGAGVPGVPAVAPALSTAAATAGAAAGATKMSRMARIARLVARRGAMGVGRAALGGVMGGPLMPLVAGAGLAYTAFDIGKGIYDEFDSDVSLDGAGDSSVVNPSKLASAMSGVESRLDITNQLLDQILARLDSGNTRPNTVVPTTAPQPKPFKAAQ